MKTFAGKTAFITGAASGIGFGIATALAREGANVVLADIRKDAVEAAARKLHNMPGKTLAVAADVSDRSSLQRAADEAEAAFGAIHVLCNNAGVAMHGVPVDRVPPEDWDWVVRVNIFGAINGAQTFVPRMRAHGEGGHIVNTASIGGFQVHPGWHTGPYSMTKYAVVAFSEALEQDLEGSGIGVSVLCPAAVATEIYLSGRSRPERFGGPVDRPHEHFVGDMLREGWPPEQVGLRVLHAIRSGEFFIFTHSAPREWIEARHRRIMEAFDRAAAFEQTLGDAAASASAK